MCLLRCGALPFTGDMNANEELRAIEALAQRLVERFPDVPAQTVSDIVVDVYARFADARCRDFVPLLVEHDAVNRLRPQARGADLRHLQPRVPSQRS
jgi:hypothetical protein